jgi:hypothetical protein
VLFQGREKPRVQGRALVEFKDVRIKDEGEHRDATIYLNISGEMGALKLHLESEPVLTQAQILSILTLGEDFSSWSQSELDQKVQSAGARILGRWAGNFIGRQLERELKKITPIDVIDVRLGGVEKLADTLVSGGGNSPNAQNQRLDQTGRSLLQDTEIGIGKYLTDKLFFNYRGTLKDKLAEQGNNNLSWESSLGLEYNIDNSKKIKVYKSFDDTSNQELFWGVEGRMEFESWSPEQGKKKNPAE